METIIILPAARLRGEVRLSGDKSIGHRAALIGAISVGTTSVANFPAGADPRSTLGCLEQLGVRFVFKDGRLVFEGRGPGGLRAPKRELNAGNSGTTVRFLAGILAGHDFEATLVGDESLNQRPMKRVVEPLRRFGARVEVDEGGRLPLKIHGGGLRAIDFEPGVASAQVKSAVLLAGMHADGTTRVREPISTRDHTEIALVESGVALRREGDVIEIDGGATPRGRSFRLPGDLSSAAFFVAGALSLPESRLRFPDLGVNPTRTAYLSLLERAGANIVVESLRHEGGEAVADVTVNASRLDGLALPSGAVAALIDELPVIAVLGTQVPGGVTIRGAAELRVKESDRIRALVDNLRVVGVEVEEFEDGLGLEGPQQIEGGTVRSYGDHRIAMAFAVAGLLSRSGVRIEGAECVDVSFPGFFGQLDAVAER